MSRQTAPLVALLLALLPVGATQPATSSAPTYPDPPQVVQGSVRRRPNRRNLPGWQGVCGCGTECRTGSHPHAIPCRGRAGNTRGARALRRGTFCTPRPKRLLVLRYRSASRSASTSIDCGIRSPAKRLRLRRTPRCCPCRGPTSYPAGAFAKCTIGIRTSPCWVWRAAAGRICSNTWSAISPI